MKTKDLITMLQVAEKLGHEDIDIVRDTGRDGYSDTVFLSADFRTVSDGNNGQIVQLVMVDKY